MRSLIEPTFLPSSGGFIIEADRCSLNGIFLSLDDLRGTVARMCTNAAVWHEDVPDYELQLPGSSIALYYRGRYFIVATRHQFKNTGISEDDFRKIGQLILSEDKIVTNAGYFMYGDEASLRDDDRYDVIAFFFDEQANVHRELRDRFFRLSRPWEIKQREICRCYAVGCACSDQRLELFGERSLNLARRSIECEYIGPTSTAGVHSIRNLNGEPFNPDGMSGGAVLFVRNSVFGKQLEFGGMIQRGGKDFFYFIDALHIAGFLDASIDI